MVFSATSIAPGNPFPGRRYALKVCFNLGLRNTYNVRDNFRTEFEELIRLPHHPNINRFYTEFVEEPNDAILAILTERTPAVAQLCQVQTRGITRRLKCQFFVTKLHGQTLEAMLNALDVVDVPENFVLRVAIDVGRALRHCFDHKVLHLDLKADNVLWTDDARAVLCDFGCAKFFGQNNNSLTLPFVDGYVPFGNNVHVCPEVLNAIRNRTQSCYLKQATFALGVLLFEVATARHAIPHYPTAYQTTVDRNIRYTAADIADITADRLRPSVVEMMKRMVAFNISDRPSIHEVVNFFEQLLEGKATMNATSTNSTAPVVPGTVPTAATTTATAAATTTATACSQQDVPGRLIIRQTNGLPINGAQVVALPNDGPAISKKSGDDGTVKFELLKTKTYRLLVAHPNFKAKVVEKFTNQTSAVIMSAPDQAEAGSQIIRGTGQIPGFSGTLNPIRDSSNRLYMYANNVAIEDGKPQPTTYKLNTPLKVEDVHGKVLMLNFRVASRQSGTFLLDYATASESAKILTISVRVRVNTAAAVSTSVPQARVTAMSANGVTVSAMTDNEHGTSQLNLLRNRTWRLLVTHPDYAAYVGLPFTLTDGANPVHDIQLQMPATPVGSVTIFSTGNIPGLKGRLNPILDTSNRTYLYANNIAIDGGVNQPGTFAVDKPFTLEDASGTVMKVIVRDIRARVAVLDYRRQQ